jgi:hypothetical protein
MLRTCSADGCEILTLGELCAVHEPVPERKSWPRGRPYPELGRETRELDLADVEPQGLRHPNSVLELSP